LHPPAFQRAARRLELMAWTGGKDVFVCLPTGFGKSLCFQALPFLFDHRCASRRNCVIVFSPLVALMADQVKNLKKKGVQAVVISSDTRDTIAKEFLASRIYPQKCKHHFLLS
jgi:ATP-dependent DNA helicase RecQ